MSETLLKRKLFLRFCYLGPIVFILYEKNGDFAVDSGIKVNIDKIDRLQNRSLRCVKYCLDATKRKSMGDLYHKFNVETLSMRRQRNLLKIVYGESKDNVNIDTYRPRMTLRSARSVKLNHKFTKLSKLQKNLYYRGLALWDYLPDDIQKAETKLTLKSFIKKQEIVP